jgi:hypothetical protein
LRSPNYQRFHKFTQSLALTPEVFFDCLEFDPHQYQGMRFCCSMLLFKLLLFVSFLVSPICANPSQENPVREWTNAEGTATFSGTFIEIRDGLVTIVRQPDAIRFEVPLERLSVADRAWIDSNKNTLTAHGSNRNQAKNPVTPEMRWPRHLRVSSDYQIEVVSEDRSNNRFIYRSNHFEFVSDVPLSRRVIREFGQIFEVTYQAIAAMPLRWDPQPPVGTHFDVRLFGERSAYYAAGGLPNSGGVYMGNERKILVPLTSVGMQRTSSEYTFDSNADFRILIHEITHQVHHHWLQRLPIWLVEGLAVYMDNVPYANGELRFDRLDVNAAFSRRSREGLFVPLETMMALTGSEWNQQLAQDLNTARLNYATAFLMAWFFFHTDNDGVNMYRYLRAIEEGMPEIEARDFLLNGRTLEELQRDFIRGFERQRLRLKIV